METPYRFYTYAYLREDRTPYYIGKGKGRRLYQKGKGEVYLPKDKSRIIFLKQNLTEQEAFKHEKYMIAVFGRKDLGNGILRNRTDGGEGNSGRIGWNKGKKGYLRQEVLKRMSERQRGEKNHNYGKVFSTETKKKMSENQMGEKNNFYGKTHTLETKKKISEKSKGRTLSLEAKQKISKANKGKNVSKETIEKFKNNFKKNYYLISPTGNIIEEYGSLCDICKKYNLDVSALSKVKNGKQKKHKGWTFLKADGKIDE